MRAILVAAFLMAFTSAAAAQDIGNQLRSIISDIWNPFFLLIAVGSAILGIFMLAKGLMKIVEASQSGGRNGYGSGITFIVVASLLISLPDVAGIGMTSILGQAKGGATLGSAELDYNDSGMSGNFLDRITGGLAGAAAPENCLESEAPATCMAGNVAKNAVPMAIMALFAIVFLVGMIGFAMTIMEIAKSTEQGQQRGGHVTKLVTSVLLMNAPLFYTQVTRTMLGTIDSPLSEMGALNAESALLRYPVGSQIAVVQNYAQIIGHSFTILTFFGAWAFVRGIFMIKGVAEAGRQAGSYGMAATYIVAGILMANSKFSACLVLSTFGGETMGAGFCGG